MAPRDTVSIQHQPTLKFKYPKNRNVPWKSADTWLDDKRRDDDTRGLWRVHNKLYDVTSFIGKHPGGRMWLELTKGTDITEAFECHHLSTKAEEALKKYFVRAAKMPRNSPFTFEENGFYLTLKRRIAPHLINFPKESTRFSNITTDLLCLGAVVFAILAAVFWSYTLGCVSGIFLGATAVAAHNYFHKKDNFRMYYFELSLMNVRDWRITHVLSHHLFPNTIVDYEVSGPEPLFAYLPHKKTWMVKYGSWGLASLFWFIGVLIGFTKRIVTVFYLKQTKHLRWCNLAQFFIPAVMYLVAGQPVLATIWMWLYVVCVGSFFFNSIGFTAAHHHPEIFHEGDAPRSADKIDWGIFQLDAVADRYEVTGSHFLVLTTFGDHALHHMFPTIDHGRDAVWKSGDAWLEDKRNDDGAEGLWRVHDKLYDVTKFIDKHPGGRMWLELSKGTDITEVFESHHLSSKPAEIIEQFFVRSAKTPRNSPFTFEDTGFYRTLKRRIANVLKDVPKDTNRMTNLATDAVCLGVFVFGILSAIFWSYTYGIIAGILLGCTTIASHNYVHMKDNFRMYYFELSLMNFRDWRITHTLSHHMFPNTIIDFEISLVEPFFVYLPMKKTWMVKYGSWLLVLIGWINLFVVLFMKRVYQVAYLKQTDQLHWSNLVTFSLPASMYLFGGQSLAATICMWLFIVTCASSMFGIIGFTAAHHHPEIFHDGDMPRSRDKMDWGEYQLDAVADRYDITGSPFRVLFGFGDHGLHHLFPTLDHGTLQYLYEEFQKVAKEFGVNLRMTSQLELMKGQFMQLAKEEPNLNKPLGNFST